MTEELIIDDNNFTKYFHDVRTNTPQKGEIMVSYEANAELIDGPDKQRLVDMLLEPDKAVAATQHMKNVMLSCEKDCVRIPKEIVEDLKNGLTVQQVLEKNYKFRLEMFFYTRPEYLPNDPHWRSISLIYMDKYFEAKENLEKEKLNLVV